jgi:Phosphotransferase enzyme family
MRDAPLIRTPDEISPSWLSQALGRPALDLIGSEPIGTGQMSQNHRVRFRPGGHVAAGEAREGGVESVVVKLASADPTSRATGVGLGAYMREVTFYRELSGRINGPGGSAGGPLAGCHLAAFAPAEGWFTLVLEDVVPAVQGDQIAGCDVAQAEIAIRALARIQAPLLGDIALSSMDYLNLPNPLTQPPVEQLLPGFLERYGDRIDPEHAKVCRAFVAGIDGWWADRRPPLGLVHGDYRLDNLLFADGRCTVVDWQTMTWGSPLLDVAYFIGNGLSVPDRRAVEESLIELYHQALEEAGGRGLSLETCWEEYRRQVFYGLVLTIVAAMIVERTDRGDEMFMACISRAAQQVIDLESLSLLATSDPTRPARPVALRPAAVDEGRHQPGPELLWNESWYFDGVTDDGSLGVYVRIGRLPNQGCCLYTACVCGPGRPSIMLVDPAAPLPDAGDDAQVVKRPGLLAEHVCEQPLERWRVRLTGRAEAHADQSAPLRAERGEPIDVELDLVWDTDGVPYAWRQSTRYEIPCRVSGVMRIGDEEITFAGPGQRDHSWSARDWWAIDWVWSALHLEDGTHTHAVGIPPMPGYGVGYVQREGQVAEIETVDLSFDVAEDGLVARTTIASGPDELAVEVTPLAFGALRLESPDGRVSQFPRAMCRARTADGREGLGWIEWNQVQR